MKKITFFVMVGILLFSATLQAQTCLTTNIAYNKPVTVSAQNQYHEGAAAVDQNMNTDWALSSSLTDAHIYVDLGESYDVCKVKITWSSNGRGSNYKIQVSTDASTWTDIFTRTGNTNEVDEITTAGTGRYVRVLMSAKVNTWSGYEMKELEIYNSIAGDTPPTTSITSPSNNSSHTAGSNIAINANAADADGNVVKVEFFQGTTKLGESTTAPYSYVWSNVPAGSYSLTTKATDNDNAVTTSSAVAITVNAAAAGSAWLLTGNSGTTPGTNFLGTTDNQSIVVKANNAEAMRILANGNVGIGTDAPGYKLDVNGSARFAGVTYIQGPLTYINNGLIDNSNASAQLNFPGDGSVGLSAGVSTGVRRLTILPDGNVGIGVTSPTAQLHTTGSIRFAGLGNNNALDRVLVSDANGILSYRDVSTIAGGTAGWAYGGNAVGAQTALGTTSNFALPFITNGTERMRILANGTVAIGTTTVPAGAKLAVEGTIYARKIKVEQAAWPDYVFDKNYRLRPLSEVEQFIKQNNHLPDVPSAGEVTAKGLDMGDNQAVLLKKIEELTLYIIQQEKRIQTMEAGMRTLQKKMNKQPKKKTK
jgi:hypothetical protein